MAYLHDLRIRYLEDLIVAMPQVTYRFEPSYWPGTTESQMPAEDRAAACEWLHRVNVERADILSTRAQLAFIEANR